MPRAGFAHGHGGDLVRTLHRDGDLGLLRHDGSFHQRRIHFALRLESEALCARESRGHLAQELIGIGFVCHDGQQGGGENSGDSQ